MVVNGRHWIKINKSKSPLLEYYTKNNCCVVSALNAKKCFLFCACGGSKLKLSEEEKDDVCSHGWAVLKRWVSEYFF